MAAAGHDQPVEAGDAVLDVAVEPFEAGTVVVGHERQSDGSRVVEGPQFAYEHEITERLGHLGSLVGDHPDMCPVAGERFAGGRLALGDLTLVVGEDQVVAAPVEVDGWPVGRHGHSGAFDMPTGPSGAERGVPGGFVIDRGLPEDEVQRLALAGVVGLPAPLGCEAGHGGLVIAAHVPKPGEGRGVKERGAVDGVGVPALGQAADQLHHGVDGAGGRGFSGGRA